MDSLEITLQNRRGDQWPVVAEHRRPGVLPVRGEGRLQFQPGFADFDDFASRLTGLLGDPRDYGTCLGEALFQDSIRDRFMAARGAAGTGGVRTLLVVEDPALQTLRWERLCAPDGRGGWDFLALDQRSPYSRYLPSLTDRRFPAIGRRDLRALVVLADLPADNPYGLAPFDAATTAAGIAEALGGIPRDLLGPVTEAQGPASLDALAERVTQGACTLLHLVAHGLVRNDGETVLFLLDAAGQVAPVTATDLIRRLGHVGAERGLPHLVFLATCEGAKPEAEAALGGLAQRLVRDLGIPAVVAMTSRVSIDTAMALAAAFYNRLRISGEPDLALVEAGAALQGRPDCLVPALFGRLGGRPLFSDRLDGDRPLTPAEIDFGLQQLAELIPQRAPTLLEDFEVQARSLRSALGTDAAALSEPARRERSAALDALDALAQEVLDLSFPALALGQPVPDWDGRCPFPGLKAFQSDDQGFFFGREAQVQTLSERLRAERLLAVLGASGSGKSSLVLAGLVPAFVGAAPDAGEVRYLTPGADPESALARQLAEPLAAGRDTLLIVDQLEELFTLCTDPARRQGFIDRLLATWRDHPRLHLVFTLRADFWGDCAPFPALKGLMQAHQELIAPMTTAELRSAMEQQAAAVDLRFEADLSHRILAEVEGEPGAMPLLQHLLLELWRRRHGRWLRASEYRALGGIKQAIAHTADGIYVGLRDDPAAQGLLRGLFVRLTRLDASDANTDGRRDTRQRVPLPELIPAGADPAQVRALVQRLADARLVVTTTDPDRGETQVEVSHEALIRHWPRLRGWLDEDRASWILLAAIRQQARDWQEGGERETDLPRWGERLQQAEALFAQPRFAPTESERRFVSAARSLDERERAEREARQRERLAALELAAIEQRRKARIAWTGAGVAAILTAVALFFGFESNRAKELAQGAQQAAEEQAREARHQTGKVHWANAVAAREDDPLRAAHAFARAAEAFEAAGRAGQAANAVLALRFIHDCPRLLAVLGHQDGVTAASWSRDGRRILTSSNDGTARLWDALTGAPLVVPLRHEDRVLGATFSPDQTRVLTWSWDGSARLWDAENGEPLDPPLKHADSVYGARFNADGARVLTRSGRTARVWDSDTREPLDPPLTHGEPVRGGLFSPDEQRILTWGDDGRAQVWDAATHRPATPPLEHGDPVSDARFSLDGALVLSWSLKGGPRVWDAEGGRELTGPPGQGQSSERDQIAGADFSADGAAVLSWSGDEWARLASPLTGKVLRELAHPTRVAGGRLEGRGRLRLLTWDLGGAVHVWGEGADDGDTADLTLRHANRVEGARSSDDGARLLTWTGDSTRRTGRIGLRSARIWDARSGAPLTPPLAHGASVRGAQLSPDGTRLMTWSDDGTAKVWDASGDLEPTPSLATAAEVEQLGAAAPPALLVEVGEGLTRLLDPVSRESLSVPLADVGSVRGARLSPDGSRLVTWHRDGPARRWDTRTGQELTPPLAHQRPVTGARFSPDGARILTWSQDGSARVWDAESGAPLTPALRRQGPVNGADFGADASRILSWGNDGTARLWDGDTGAALSPPLRHPSGEPGRYSAVMEGRLNPEGTRALTRDEKGVVRAWDLSLGSDWPIGALGLRLEAETGTALAPTGEMQVLGPVEWRRVRYCGYDRIRHDLGRLSDAAWDDARRRCREAQAEAESKGGGLPGAGPGRSDIGG